MAQKFVSVELLGCPVCGSEPLVATCYHHAWISCKDGREHVLRATGKTLAEAAAIWNGRRGSERKTYCVDLGGLPGF